MRYSIPRLHTKCFRQSYSARDMKAALRRTAAAPIETLESRLMLAAIAWNGGMGNWNIASNWTPNQVPTVGDDAMISIPGSVVNVTDSERVATITTSANTTLSIVSAGQFQVDTSGMIAGSFNATGATLVPTSLALGGTSDLSSCYIAGGSFSNSGTLTVHATELADATLDNTGSVIVDGGSTLQNTSSITNEAHATFTLDDLTGINNGNNRNGTITNSGTLILNGGSGTADIVGTVLKDTGGTINVQSGMLSDEFNAYFQNATFTISAGAAFAFDPISPTDGSDTFYFSGTSTGSGAGNVLFNSGNVTAGNPDSSSATTANLDFPAGLAEVTGTSFNNGNSGGEVTNTGVLDYVGASGHASMGMINQGTIAVLGLGDLDVNSNGSFTNGANGTVDFETDAGVDGDGTAFINTGLIQKTGGSGISTIGMGTSGTNDVGFQSNGGSYDVESGTIAIVNGGQSYPFTVGTINAAPGDALDLGGVAQISSTLTSVTGGGALVLTGELDGPGNGTTILNFGANQFDVEGGTINDYYDFNAGTIQYIGAGDIQGLTNQGTITFDAGPLRIDALANAASGTLDFTAAQQPLEQGNGGLGIANSGTMIFSPGTENTFDLSNMNTSNAGTIEVTSGTLNLPWIPTNYYNSPGLFPNFAGLPAGSTVIVDAGANVTVATTPALTSIAGTLVLGGAGASFPAFDGLTTLTGTMKVLSGDSFTTSASLSNSGTLSVGGNFTVDGNYTQTSTGTLDFDVAANPNASGAPDFTVQDNTILAGNLTAEYANGFTTSGGAYTAATFDNAATGSFASTSGVGPFFTVSVTSANITLNGSANNGGGGGGSNSVDLAVSDVTGPSTFGPGQSAMLNWTVTDDGSAEADGSWTDSVYLSTDTTLDSSDVLLGFVTHTGPLAAAGSYAGTLTVNMPTVLPGTYYVLVETDSAGVLADNNRTNNLAASTAITGTFPTLTIGQTTNATIAFNQPQVYMVTVPAGTSVSLNTSFASLDEANLYVAAGRVATLSDFDDSFPDTIVQTSNFLLGGTQTTTYYILVYGREGAGTGGAFSITPAVVPYGPVSVSTAAGANNAEVTLTINGTGFTPTTAVNLLGTVAGAGNIAASSVIFVNSNQLYAIFRLTNAIPGAYDLQTNQGEFGAIASLPGAFIINALDTSGKTTGASAPGQLEFYLSAPSFIRAGTAGTLTLYYQNIGGSDIDAPLFEITGDNASFELAGQGDYTDNLIDVLGTNPTGPAGLLTPGAFGSVQISFTQDNPGPHVVSNFKAYVLNPLTKTNWDGLKSHLKPATISQAGWDQIYANFENLVGTTVGSYNAALVNLADTLGAEGVRSTDAAFYLSQELLVAGDFGAIEYRNAFSYLGYGQTDPYDATLTLDSAGDAAIGSGEDLRYYTKNANGSYTNVDSSDGSVLVKNSNGTYTLSETNGEKTIFNSDGTLNSFFDTQGNQTAIGLTNGLVTKLTDAFGGITTINRSSTGMITQIIDPQGRSTSFGYDSSGNLISISNAAGATAFTYANPSSHEVTEMSNPNGTDQFFSYDTFGRVSGESFDNDADPITFTYDAYGDVTQTNGLNHSVTLSRGVDGEITAVQDALGNVLQASFGASATPATTTDSLGVRTTNTFDSSGNITAIISASGATVAIKYNANHDPLSITDPDGNATTFTYDANGNLLTTTDAAGHFATNAYTALNLLQQSTSAGGRVIHNSYNSAGQLIAQTFSDSTSASYSYDAHGNLISATNAFGTDSFTYDSADRLTKVTYPDGLSLTYTYNSNGQLIQTIDQTGFSTNYAYNAQGQLDELTDSSGNMLAAYTYDAAGHLTRTDLGNGTYTTYSYDFDGRQTGVFNFAADGSVTSSFTYVFNANGQITSMTSIAGISTYTYDVDGELTGASLPDGRTMTWTYDKAGNLISSTDSFVSSITYTTNNRNEYTAASGATYSYDADGNLISSTDNTGTTTYMYNVLEELTSIAAPSGTTTFTYDALGNRVAETVNGVTTDLLVNPLLTNGLVGQFTTTGTAEAQFIDGLGLVGESISSGAANYYAFDAAGNVAALTGSSGAVLNTYTYLPFGQPLTATGSTANPFTFDGRDGVQSVGNGNYLTQTRLYSSTLGRFTQRDPTGLTGGDKNLYRYVKNNPVDFGDPTGEVVGVVTGTAAGLLDAILTGQSAFSVLNAGLQANLATAGTTTGFVSTLSANTGTYFTAAGSLEVSSAGAAYASLSPGVPTLVAISGGPATEIAVTTGTFAVANGAWVAVPAAVVTAPITVPASVVVAGTTALFVAADQGGKKLSDVYMRLEAGPVVDGQIDRNSLIQHIMRSALGRTLLSNVNPATVSIATLQFYLQVAASAQHTTQTQAVASGDPNDIVGPSGFGSAGFIPGAEPLPYQIDFTNESTASAPAQVVVITQQLSSNLDLSTFQLGTIGFGNTTITVPADLQTYSTTVSLSSTLSVEVSANLDELTGLVTWTFTSIDPSTGQVQTDPLSGFLPPDATPPEGEGFVDYTVMAKADSPSGTVLSAQATVVFDNNDPISTSLITNTIDAAAPTSTVAALPASLTSPNFTVSWSGSDDTGGSGIASYTIFISEDSGTYTPWMTTTTAGSAVYEGALGHTYAFYSLATDNVGNEQPLPSVAQTTTNIPAADRFVTVTGKTKGTYTDAQGNLVTITLSGSGTATLGFIGNGNSDPVSFIVTGTTAKSSITIKVSKGTTTLTGVQITGSLNSFNAKAADLTGSFDITGTLNTLIMDNVNGGASTIDVEGAGSTTFKFGTLQGLSLTVTGTIKSLSAASWSGGASGTDAITAGSIVKMSIKGASDANVTLSSGSMSATIGSITAGTWTIGGSIKSLSTGTIAGGWAGTITGSIGTLTVKGNVDATLTAAAISSLNVTGNIANSIINTTGNIGKVSVGGMSNSALFAGITSGTTGLPTVDDFADASSILSFTVKGTTLFANSDIAAETVGTVKLANVTTNNSGTPFGVATKSLKSFALQQPKQKPVTWHAGQSTSIFNMLPGDLHVDLL